jgi:hypothetical protein
VPNPAVESYTLVYFIHSSDSTIGALLTRGLLTCGWWYISDDGGARVRVRTSSWYLMSKKIAMAVKSVIAIQMRSAKRLSSTRCGAWALGSVKRGYCKCKCDE